jgi:hypothetical protein
LQGIHIRRRLAAVLVAVAVSCPAAVHTRTTDTSAFGCGATAPVPANITVEAGYLTSVTRDIAARSPSFRRRLVEIGMATNLRARLHLTWRPVSSAAIAQTVFSRAREWLFADIQIPRSLVFARLDVRMIAHEIEHVVEQLEGHDLSALARRPDTGVRYLRSVRAQIFETERAIAFGQRVEREFQDAGSVIAPCSAN